MIPQEPKGSTVRMRTKQFETCSKRRSGHQNARPKSWQSLHGSGNVRSQIQKFNQ